MPLPFFFEENLLNTSGYTLTEESSKHIAQVLRMEKGDKIQLTNGKGLLLTAEIFLPHKKKTEVKLISEEFADKPRSNVTIAISLIKNASRFEWFVEKATEIGVTSIVPLLCKRTEKTHFRFDRIKSIMISAMLQSRQAWLPLLYEPQKINDVIKNNNYGQKFIAHCIEGNKKELKEIIPDNSSSKIIMIGPEGDFTEEEIHACLNEGFAPVSLGNTRLRTETAGVAAAVWLQ